MSRFLLPDCMCKMFSSKRARSRSWSPESITGSDVTLWFLYFCSRVGQPIYYLAKRNRWSRVMRAWNTHSLNRLYDSTTADREVREECQTWTARLLHDLGWPSHARPHLQLDLDKSAHSARLWLITAELLPTEFMNLGSFVYNWIRYCHYSLANKWLYFYYK